jgi:hypothetical protein
MIIEVTWDVNKHINNVDVDNNFNKCYNKQLEDIFY